VRVVSEETARALARMMTDVTRKGGTAELAAVPGFDVAGKTGTAQKVDPVTRSYSHQLYVASFTGFVPADRPKVAILVLIDEPRGGTYYGGLVAAPAFRQIALAALASLDVFPEDPEAREAFLASHRPPEPEPQAGPEASDEPEAIAALAPASAAEPPGPTEVDPPSPEADPLLDLPEPPAPVAGNGDEAEVMPNFGGLQVHEVLKRTAEVRCDPVILGSGRVVSQSPMPGAPLPKGSTCEVTLADRR
jgi:cell division protein FtsI (penicillin-binding protein 3)